MARFIKFPGSAGAYVDTADVNLLDADTAHNFQGSGVTAGRGEWIGGSQVNVAEAFSGKGLSSLFDVFNSARTNLDVFSVAPSMQYSVSGFIAPEDNVSGDRMFLQVFYRDNALNTIGNDIVDDRNPIVIDGRQQFSGTFTTPPLTAFVYLLIGYRSSGGGAPNKTAVWDSFCLREGTDATFKPSLRIVGDLDMEQDVEPELWVPVSSQFLMSSRESVGFSGYGIGLLTNGNMFTYYGDGVSDRSVQLLHGLTDGKHVLRQTFTVADGVWKLFVDAVEVATDTSTVGAGAVGVNNPLAFGADRLGVTGFYAGAGFTGIVRDGIDGPIVARFDAEDVGI